MPYQVKNEGSKFCVHKKMDDRSMGRKMGCHDTKPEAMAQMRALYAAEGAKKEVEDIDLELKELGLSNKQIEDLTEKCMGEMASMGTYVPWGVKSFDELDAWHDAQAVSKEISDNTYAFQRIVENIMSQYDVGLNEKMAAVRELADEFASRVESSSMEHKEAGEEFIEIVDDSLDSPELLEEEEKAKRADVSPADKKRAVEEYGNVTYADPTNKKYPLDSESHVRSAWSYINMPKNAKKYPDGGAAIKRKIVAAWKKKIDPAGPPSATKEVDEETLVERVFTKVKSLLGIKDKTKDDGFLIFKEADGSYTWIARYSNNFRDQDNPPEIIASQSHKSFVEKVEKGIAKKPDLWIWHVKEWPIGAADWVAWDDTGFALAGGHSLPGMEAVFDQVSKLKEVRVSHGMPKSTIVRDSQDQTIIVEHETREISILPSWAAANPLTGFVVMNAENKEAEMAISKEQKEELVKKWGLSEDTIKIIEAANAADASKAKDEGLEHKENEAAPPPPVTEPVAVSTAPADASPAAETTSGAALIAALNTAIAPVIEKLNALDGEVKALKEKAATEQDVLTKALEKTPAASILSMFGSQVKSAIGSEETQVDGRTSLAKQKPAEPKENIEGRTFVPFINEILAG